MSLNIGGSDDAFFRYKMPDMLTKIEGRGNGIKTVITNMAEVAAALKRDPGYPTKYFATELGALSKWDDKRLVAIVNGEHSKEALKKLLDDFIRKYVLCPTCHLPETDLIVKKDKIYAICKACGWRGLSDNTHKLATYILNHPPNKDKAAAAAKPSKKEKRQAKIEKSKAKPGDEAAAEDDSNGDEEQTETSTPAPSSALNDGAAEAENGEANEEGDGQGEGEGEGAEDGEWEFEVTEEMKNVAVTDHAELEDPVEEMAKLLQTHGSATVPVRVEKVKEFQKQKNFTDEETLQYVFKALVTDNMAEQVKNNIQLIKKMASPLTKNNQILIVALLEERCEANPDNLKAVPSTLMVLYDEDVVEEDTITMWYAKGLSQLVALADEKAARKARKAADKFIEWLKNAEEESDEE